MSSTRAYFQRNIWTPTPAKDEQLEAEYCQQLQDEIGVADKFSKITTGKHSGKMFGVIATTDPTYCGWVLGQHLSTNLSLRQFKKYLINKLAE